SITSCTGEVGSTIDPASTTCATTRASYSSNASKPATSSSAWLKRLDGYWATISAISSHPAAPAASSIIISYTTHSARTTTCSCIIKSDIRNSDCCLVHEKSSACAHSSSASTSRTCPPCSSSRPDVLYREVLQSNRSLSCKKTSVDVGIAVDDNRRAAIGTIHRHGICCV